MFWPARARAHIATGAGLAAAAVAAGACLEEWRPRSRRPPLSSALHSFASSSLPARALFFPLVSAARGPFIDASCRSGGGAAGGGGRGGAGAGGLVLASMARPNARVALAAASLTQPSPAVAPSAWDGRTPGASLTRGIIAANVAVWLAWLVPAARVRAAMERWFLTSPAHLGASRAGVATVLLSTYSHMSVFHLGANMLGLASFGPALVDGRRGARRSTPAAPLLSPAGYLLLYHAAGVLAGAGSNLFSAACGVSRPALGASGAVFGVVAYYALSHPAAPVLALFVIETDARTALVGATAVNVGLALAARSAALTGARGPGIDGVAHLVGTAVGAAAYAAASRSVAVAGAGAGGPRRSGEGAGRPQPPPPPRPPRIVVPPGAAQTI